MKIVLAFIITLSTLIGCGNEVGFSGPNSGTNLTSPETPENPIPPNNTLDPEKRSPNDPDVGDPGQACQTASNTPDINQCKTCCEITCQNRGGEPAGMAYGFTARGACQSPQNYVGYYANFQMIPSLGSIGDGVCCCGCPVF